MLCIKVRMEGIVRKLEETMFFIKGKDGGDCQETGGNHVLY
jgi:hypothetical protein